MLKNQFKNKTAPAFLIIFQCCPMEEPRDLSSADLWKCLEISPPDKNQNDKY